MVVQYFFLLGVGFPVYLSTWWIQAGAYLFLPLIWWDPTSSPYPFIFNSNSNHLVRLLWVACNFPFHVLSGVLLTLEVRCFSHEGCFLWLPLSSCFDCAVGPDSFSVAVSRIPVSAFLWTQRCWLLPVSFPSLSSPQSWWNLTLWAWLGTRKGSEQSIGKLLPSMSHVGT